MVSCLLFLVFVADDAALPDLVDLELFPCGTVADQQLCRMGELRQVLRECERIHGHSGGWYDRQHALLDRDERYWHLIRAASSQPFGFAEHWQRGRLQEIRDLIGESAYWSGWHPPLIPERVESPFPRAIAVMPPAGNNS